VDAKGMATTLLQLLSNSGTYKEKGGSVAPTPDAHSRIHFVRA